jgi:hypothetical protein
MSRRSVPKPIYGFPCPPPLCEDGILGGIANPLLVKLLGGLLKDLTETVSQTAVNVELFFPGSTAFANLVAPMGATLTMSPALMMRFLWMKAHPGIIFDSMNHTALLQLKDLYLKYGYDWTTDRVLNSETRPPVISPMAKM